jgi:hypothetical protein
MNEFELEDISIAFLHFKNYKFIANKEKTFIVSEDGKSIAELEVSSNAVLIDGILYDVKDKSIVAIDLKGIIY